MGWVNWPDGIPTTSTGIGSLGTAYSYSYNNKQVWDWLEQGWRAYRERHTPFNCTMMWPPGDAWGPFSNGTVSSIVNNGDGTMTVTPADGFTGWDVSEGCSSPRFAPGYTCGECLTNIPSSYDLIITTDATYEDPFQVYRGSITAMTYDAGPPTSGTLTIQSQTILDCITAGYLDSLTTLNGAAWYIIKSGSPWTSERLPDKPDPAAEWIGTNSTGGTTTITIEGTPTTYSTLTDTTWPNFAPHDSITYEVVVYGSDGALHRETIISNNGNQLLFTERSYTASGAYRIVEAGVVGMPGRTIRPMYAYYTGLASQYYTHLTDGKNDSIGAWNIAGNQVSMQKGDVCSGTCEGTTYKTLDGDLFFPVDGTCNGQSAGTFVGVNYWKSFHALQKDIEELCKSYLPYKDYTFATAIPLWTTAKFFSDNSINAWSCEYDYVDGSDLTVSGTPTGDDYAPSLPIPCYYQITYADGSVSGGPASLSSATNLTGATFPDPATTTPAPTSLTLSLAWSRVREEQLSYMFAHTGFVPSLDDGGVFDPPVVVDNGDGTFTAECGTWEKRAKSTTYLTRQANGMAADGSRAFIDGRMCRWVGDNANNPSISPVTAIGDSTAPLVPYWDKMFRGTYGKIIQQQRKANLSGTITGWQAGTTNALTDAGKNWWIDGVNGNLIQTASGTISSVVDAITTPTAVPNSAVVAAAVPANVTSCSYVVTDTGTGAFILKGTSGVTPGTTATLTALPCTNTVLDTLVGQTVTMTFQGSLHVETGTVTSGTSTSITTNIDTTSYPAMYWWASRFLGFSGDGSPYTEFTCEIDKEGTIVKVPITSTVVGDGVVINFDEVTGFAPATGATISIIEPAYEINRFQFRIVTIVDTNTSNIYTSTITYNDYNTLFFGQVYQDDEAVTISPALDGTWNYSITDPDCGGVWKWNASTGRFTEVTSGSDTERLGVTSPQDFLKDSRGNLANLFRDYGAMQPGDLLTDKLFGELQTAINSMIATTTTFNWTSRHDPTVPENNVVPGVYAGGVTEPTFTGYIFDSGTAYAGFGACDGKTIFTTWEESIAAAQSDILAYLGSPGPWTSGPPSNACGDVDCGITPYEDTSNTPPTKHATANVDVIQETGLLDGDTFGNCGADIESNYEYATVSGVCTLFSATIDFYNYAECYGCVPSQEWEWSSYTGYDYEGDYDLYISTGSAIQFESSGDAVLHNQWKKWDSESIDGSGNAISIMLGSPTTGTLPTLEADPSAPGSNFEWQAGAVAGYSVCNWLGILKWSFTYV